MSQIIFSTPKGPEEILVQKLSIRSAAGARGECPHRRLATDRPVAGFHHGNVHVRNEFGRVRLSISRTTFRPKFRHFDIADLVGLGESLAVVLLEFHRIQSDDEVLPQFLTEMGKAILQDITVSRMLSRRSRKGGYRLCDIITAHDNLSTNCYCMFPQIITP